MPLLHLHDNMLLHLPNYVITLFRWPQSCITPSWLLHFADHAVASLTWLHGFTNYINISNRSFKSSHNRPVMNSFSCYYYLTLILPLTTIKNQENSSHPWELFSWDRFHRHSKLQPYLVKTEKWIYITQQWKRSVTGKWTTFYSPKRIIGARSSTYLFAKSCSTRALGLLVWGGQSAVACTVPLTGCIVCSTVKGD